MEKKQLDDWTKVEAINVADIISFLLNKYTLHIVRSEPELNTN